MKSWKVSLFVRRTLVISGGFILSTIAASAIAPVEGRFQFVQIPSCYAINAWDNISHGITLSEATSITLYSHRQINELLDKRENSRASYKDNENDIRIIKRILRDHRRSCTARNGCDVSKYDENYEVDSYWMSQPLTLREATQKAERSKERFDRAIEDRDELERETITERKQAKDRLSMFTENSKYCQNFLDDGSVKRARGIVGL